MGSIGNTSNTPKTFVGRSVDDLYNSVKRKDSENYADLYDRLRKDFNIPDASEKQLDTLRRIISGINGYDRGYDEGKTPYNIVYYSVQQIGGYSEEEKVERKSLGLKTYRPVININISTEPNTENAYVRMVDRKSHSAIIGSNGGLYTYSDKGHSRKNLTEFDVAYGKRSY